MWKFIWNMQPLIERARESERRKWKTEKSCRAVAAIILNYGHKLCVAVKRSVCETWKFTFVRCFHSFSFFWCVHRVDEPFSEQQNDRSASWHIAEVNPDIAFAHAKRRSLACTVDLESERIKSSLILAHSRAWCDMRWQFIGLLLWKNARKINFGLFEPPSTTNFQTFHSFALAAAHTQCVRRRNEFIFLFFFYANRVIFLQSAAAKSFRSIWSHSHATAGT